MSDFALRTVGLGKQYRIGAAEERVTSLRDAISRAAGAPLRNLRRLRSLTSFSGGDAADVIWALREVSLEVRHGEVLGLVGRNGAGKSTLLKILSRITAPSAGFAEVRGHVGSLLEVGTGFHPDLTGRDNVYLNGAILGMDRAQIDRKFDEIVAFSGVERFIDTPVKRYSSGMYLRLAFAVAAHLEPDVLIVDEVLAVGDAEFQRKCLGKMDDVAREGRTILFVSHNMNAVQRLCTRGVILEGGRKAAEGPARDIVAQYLASAAARGDSGAPAAGKWIDVADRPRSGSGEARFESVRFASDDPAIGYAAYPGGPLDIDVRIQSADARRVASVSIMIFDQHGTKLINTDTVSIGLMTQLRAGLTEMRFSIAALHLSPGTYVLGLWLSPDPGYKAVLDTIEAAFRLTVFDMEPASIGAARPGVVACAFTAAVRERAADDLREASEAARR